MLLHVDKDLDRRDSRSSFEFLRIHISLTPLLEKLVSQYFCRPSLTSVRIDVNKTESGFVEHLADPAIKRCLYGSLVKFRYPVQGREIKVFLLGRKCQRRIEPTCGYQ